MKNSKIIDNIIKNTSLSTGKSKIIYSLEESLMKIAKIIKGRKSLKLSQQMFYVEMNGFDTHKDQKTKIEGLYTELDYSLNSFKLELEDMNEFNNVTTFISSDFGRNASSNGTGTAHGWGGNYFVMGGSVNGGKVYGDMPNLNNNDVDSDLVLGNRVVPKISVEQYASTLTKWFGISEVNRVELFPNLKNFTVNDLGFMRSV